MGRTLDPEWRPEFRPLPLLTDLRVLRGLDSVVTGTCHPCNCLRQSGGFLSVVSFLTQVGLYRQRQLEVKEKIQLYYYYNKFVTRFLYNLRKQ